MAGSAGERLNTDAWTVRLVTYNVHGAVGTDGRYDPQRIVLVLRTLDADILGLQEVDARLTPDRVIDQFAYFSAEIGFHAVAGPNIVLPSGSYGNVLLSRWPVVDAKRCDLSIGRRERRGAIIATVETPCGPLRVLTTHLGRRRRERREQLRRLQRELRREPELPCVVMGDFNIWGVERIALRRLGAPLERQAPTFPSRFPVLALDRIWTNPASMLRCRAVERSTRARAASDHLPVVADIAYARE